MSLRYIFSSALGSHLVAMQGLKCTYSGHAGGSTSCPVRSSHRATHARRALVHELGTTHPRLVASVYPLIGRLSVNKIHNRLSYIRRIRGLRLSYSRRQFSLAPVGHVSTGTCTFKIKVMELCRGSEWPASAFKETGR